MAKLDTNNKTFILSEHDLKKILEHLKFIGEFQIVMQEDETSPIVPIKTIAFVRGEGERDG